MNKVTKNQYPVGDTHKLQLSGPGGCSHSPYGLMATATGTALLELVCIYHGVLVVTILFDLLGVMVYMAMCHADQDCDDELKLCRDEVKGYANPFPWPISNQDLTTACRCVNSNII